MSADPLRFLHVQSISHWAPSNIGPYSQAVRRRDTTFLAGQIGLIPGLMRLAASHQDQVRSPCMSRTLSNLQSDLILSNVQNVLAVMGSDLPSCVLGVCYLTDISLASDVRFSTIVSSHVNVVKEQARLHRYLGEAASEPVCVYVQVPALPRGAAVRSQCAC